MQKNILGNTGLEVATLGFGGIPIQRVSQQEAKITVKTAVERGINFIDTARAYSDSEEKIGLALQELDKKVYLASKTPAENAEEAYQDVKVSIDNLQVDKIDLYQLHHVSSEENYKDQVTKKNSALQGLMKARSDGLIDHIGITGHSNDLLLRAIKENNFATVQFCYNFIETEAEEKLIPAAEERNIGMIAMKPMAGGRLQAPEIALRYILNRDSVIPIPGMESPQEVAENVTAADRTEKLNKEEKEFIEKKREELGDQFCRRCQYCLPCPEGIQIPVVLRVESFLNRMPAEKIKEGPYETFLQAENCIECEKCVEKCPYDLPIPRLLQENLELARQQLG